MGMPGEESRGNGIKLAERNFPTQGEAGFIDTTRKLLRKFAKNA